MDVSQAVDRGVELFADLEELAQDGVAIAENLKAVFDAIRDGGVISNFECKALKMEARMIAANNLAQWHIFHAKTTQRAQLKGIDIPSTEDGGGGR